MNTVLKYDNSSDFEISEVSVIGDFNSFDPEKGKMRKEQDNWVYETQLPTGEYHYKFLINGELKLTDPYNNLFEQDNDDQLWSLIMIDDKEDRLFNPNQYSVHVSDYFLTSNISENNAEISRKKFISTVDKKIAARFTFNNISGIHSVTLAWYSPDGELFEYAEDALCAEDEQENVVCWFWLEVDDNLKQSPSGIWKLRLFIDGEFVLEDLFAVETYNSLIKNYFA